MDVPNEGVVDGAVAERIAAAASLGVQFRIQALEEPLDVVFGIPGMKRRICGLAPLSGSVWESATGSSTFSTVRQASWRRKRWERRSSSSRPRKVPS